MNNELVVKEKQEVSTTTTGFGRGFENTDITTVSMPRVKVMQPTSPELQDEDYSFRQGEIIHALLMEKVPEKFIPLAIFDNRIMFAPRDEGGEILCRSFDGRAGMTHGACAQCPYSKWHNEAGEEDPQGDVPPECTQTINVLALFEGYDMPVVIPFSNTSYKFGRKFRDLALFSGGDLFSRKYKLTSLKQTNSKGTFYVLQVKPIGKVEGDEYTRAEALYAQFGNVRIEVEQEQGQTGGTEY